MPRSTTLIYLVFLAACLSSCAPQVGMGLAGTYVEAKDKRIVSLDGEEYSFMEDGTFRYKFKSDNLSASKIGFGTFSVYNDIITFQFKPQDDFEQSEVIERSLTNENVNSYKYHFEVKDVTGKPIQGANVVFLGLDIPFLGVVSDRNGEAAIETPKYHKIHGFRVSMMGFEPVEHQLIKGDHEYEVILVEKYGQRIVLSKVEKTFERRGRKIFIDDKLFDQAEDE